ncbi:MAG: hypothetical protein ACI8RD_003722 [Bacillariaceae sp.]|jgi:hypothetical protein
MLSRWRNQLRLIYGWAFWEDHFKVDFNNNNIIIIIDIDINVIDVLARINFETIITTLCVLDTSVLLFEGIKFRKAHNILYLIKRRQ